MAAHSRLRSIQRKKRAALSCICGRAAKCNARRVNSIFSDLFQNDRSILNLLDADYTFLNEDLAKHYGIPDVVGPTWRRVEGVQKFNRGGILTQATILSKQAGASRYQPNFAWELGQRSSLG